MASLNITANKSALVKSADPNTNFSTGGSFRSHILQPPVDENTYENAFIGFPDTSALNLKRIASVTLYVYVTSKAQSQISQDFSYISAMCVNTDWTESGLTWNNRPTNYTGYKSIQYSDIPTSGLLSFSITPTTTGRVDAILHGITLQNTVSLSTYGVDASMTVNMYNSRATSNKPYATVIYYDVSLSISGMLPPVGSYKKPTTENTFTWSATNNSAASTVGTVQQASAKVRVRVAGETPYDEFTVTGATGSCAIPANTMGAGNYEWQVEVTSNDSIVTTSPWVQFRTTDDTPQKAVPLSPKNTYIAIDDDATFEWQHVIDSGTDQSGADLQYSLNMGAFTGFATVTGASTTAIVSAGTLPAGNMRWRVRTYNQDGVAGEWSDPLAFVGVGAPSAPTITSVSQCNRPVITWASTGQTAYRVQIGDYDTGEVAGAVKTFKLPYYIPNGTYAVSVSIMNASLVWSAEAEYALTLAVTPPTTPTLTAAAVTNGALITPAVGADAVYTYLLRDGVPIADITGLATYTDYAALGASSYVVRVVDENDNYKDSAAATVTVAVSHATIAAVDDVDSPITLKLTRGRPREISGSTNQTVTYQYFAGREKPVAVFAEQEDEAHQVSVSFLTQAEKDAFITLVKRRKTMLYRDSWGNRWFVVIPSHGSTQDRHSTDFAVTLKVVDYVEEIDYAD